MITLFTSESVTEGHPDKICDQISDSILDACLAQDPFSRVAVETVAKTGMILVAGELTTKASLDIPAIVRGVLRDIGYTHSKYGIDAETCAVLVHLDKQSPDIARGVGSTKKIGAGDQGMMFGFACDQTEECLPLPIVLAHKLAKRLSEVRKKGIVPFLGPDGKTQVTIEYDGERVVRAQTFLISAQHDAEIDHKTLEQALHKHVIVPVASAWIDHSTRILVNPTGRFVRGGPYADTGLTGRKIIVDSYGGYARHGGGAFSGKDPTKVDRSGAYAARYIAKNIVVAGLARKCEVQLAYAIGIAEPVSILVDTFDTCAVNPGLMAALVRDHFPLTPGEIIEKLELRTPIYQKTAAYGHFGRADFPWEKTDAAQILKKARTVISKN